MDEQMGEDGVAAVEINIEPHYLESLRKQADFRDILPPPPEPEF